MVTHLHDEQHFLLEKEASQTDPLLAHQIKHYRLQHCRFNSYHLQQFKKLGQLPGFSGSLKLGHAIDNSLYCCSGSDRDIDMSLDDSPPTLSDDSDDDDGFNELAVNEIEALMDK